MRAILKYLDDNNINVVLIPPNHTDWLHSVNRSAKEFLHNEFQE